MGSRRMRLTAAVTAALLTAACSGRPDASPSGPGDGDPPPTVTASPSSSTTTTAAATTAATTTTTAAAATTTTAAAGTYDDPLPPGVPVVVGNWEVTVLSATPDATALVLGEDAFNQPPAEGRVYSLVGVAATYLGEEWETPTAGLSLSAVGASGATYGGDDHCGAVPGAFPGLTEVFPGGTVAGNLCWAVAAGDADALVVAAAPGPSPGEERYLVGVPPEGTAFPVPASHGPPTPGGASGSRGNPIRAGSPARVGDWEITVVGADRDAAPAVLAADPSNLPPPEGRRYVIVTVQAVFGGIESEAPADGMRFAAVGDAAVAYGGPADGCGVVPDALPVFDPLFPGDGTAGSLCWSVRADDAGALLLMADAALALGSDRVFFEIP